MTHPKSDFDSPWKEMLDRYFKDFMAFFFPRAFRDIDWSVDINEYAKGIKISDQEIKTLALEREEFHGEWNYTLYPRYVAHAIM